MNALPKKHSATNQRAGILIRPQWTSCRRWKYLKQLANGKRTTSLDVLHNALNSIPPTSVEAERAFSTAGHFVSNLPTQLSDHIDHICFLKNKIIRQYCVSLQSNVFFPSKINIILFTDRTRTDLCFEMLWSLPLVSRKLHIYTVYLYCTE